MALTRTVSLRALQATTRPLYAHGRAAPDVLEQGRALPARRAVRARGELAGTRAARRSRHGNETTNNLSFAVRLSMLSFFMPVLISSSAHARSTGSSWDTMHVVRLDAATGAAAPLGDTLTGVKYSTTAWTPDNKVPRRRSACHCGRARIAYSFWG